MPIHEDQVDVDERIVRQLVAEQFPHWADLDVRPVPGTGTVNAIFRVGDELAARFPLRPEDPALVRGRLEDEASAARELAHVSPVPCPVPVAIGVPGAGYPMPWSVQTWLPGTDAGIDDPAGSLGFAHDLAALMTRLRAADTRGRRFGGVGRGGHLPDHDDWMDDCLRRSEGLLDVTRLRVMWSHLRTLPEVDADVMTHGDLTPPNVVVRAGRLAGLLDGGGFAAADPALDLVSAWHLLDRDQRQILRAALGCSDVQWRRGMAWAFEQAMGIVWYYLDTNPPMSRWGRRTLDRLLAARMG